MTTIDWETNYIVATGQGFAPESVTNRTKAQILARRAAIVDGYRQLAESVKGVTIISNTTVRELEIDEDIITAKVDAVIKGAEVIEERPLPEGGYQVKMRLRIFGDNSLAQAVVKRTDFAPTPEPLQAPLPDVIPSSVVGNTTVSVVSNDSGKSAVGGFTGVVIDCRNQGLKTAMSPVIYNDREIKIYGHKNLNYDQVIANGMAGYANNEAQAKGRAGSNPLIIRAIRIKDGTNPVISVADANRMLIENGATNFLTEAKVVFLR